MKKRLSKDQEFEIMLSVFDKVLWLGFIMMGIGLYQMLASTVYSEGIYYLVAGIAFLLILSWVLVKEFHFGTR